MAIVGIKGLTATVFCSVQAVICRVCDRYLVVKDSFVAYLHPDEGTVNDVLLMDQDFMVKCGINETGVHNGLLISNLSRSFHFTLVVSHCIIACYLPNFNNGFSFPSVDEVKLEHY